MEDEEAMEVEEGAPLRRVRRRREEAANPNPNPDPFQQWREYDLVLGDGLVLDDDGQVVRAY